MSDALNFIVNTVHTVLLKYFSSFAAVKIGKKKTLFLPIFTAAKDEKYFIVFTTKFDAYCVTIVFTTKFNASDIRSFGDHFYSKYFLSNFRPVLVILFLDTD